MAVSPRAGRVLAWSGTKTRLRVTLFDCERDAATRALARRLGLAGEAGKLPETPENVVSAAALNRLLLSSRDLTAVQRALVERGLAVWLGQPFRPAMDQPPDDLERVVERIRALF